MSALNLQTMSLSRPKQLHNAHQLQRSTKNSAGKLLITRPQKHVVTASIRREEATNAAGVADNAGSKLAALLKQVAPAVMLSAALATTLGPEAAMAASGGRMGGSNFNRSKTSSSISAPRPSARDPPPREVVRESVRTETNVVVIQQAPPPLFPIVPIVPIPIVPFGGGFGSSIEDRNQTRELEQNRAVDMKQAEDIATLKAKSEFEQQQLQELRNELASLRAPAVAAK